MTSSILVFDGVCVLCSRWVQFVLRHDRKRQYRFAAMQTTTGRDRLARHGIDPDGSVGGGAYRTGSRQPPPPRTDHLRVPREPIVGMVRHVPCRRGM